MLGIWQPSRSKVNEYARVHRLAATRVSSALCLCTLSRVDRGFIGFKIRMVVRVATRRVLSLGGLVALSLSRACANRDK